MCCVEGAGTQRGREEGKEDVRQEIRKEGRWEGRRGKGKEEGRREEGKEGKREEGRKEGRVPISQTLQVWTWSRLVTWGFPGSSDGKESACSAGDLGLIPGLGRSPEKEIQPTTVFLPGKSHGQRSLVGYSPWGHESDTT